MYLVVEQQSLRTGCLRPSLPAYVLPSLVWSVS